MLRVPFSVCVCASHAYSIWARTPRTGAGAFPVRLNDFLKQRVTKIHVTGSETHTKFRVKRHCARLPSFPTRPRCVCGFHLTPQCCTHMWLSPFTAASRNHIQHERTVPLDYNLCPWTDYTCCKKWAEKKKSGSTIPPAPSHSNAAIRCTDDTAKCWRERRWRESE